MSKSKSRDKTIAIIQARCNSTRLKNKVLADVDGRPMIQRIIHRVRKCQLVSEVVVATSENLIDKKLVDWCNENEVNVFCGSEKNVLERFYQAAKKFEASVIVRVTADDPFKDPSIIDYAINLLLENRFDYVSNTIKPTFPEGIDIEVFKYSALERAFEEAELHSEKEHVTPYIWKNKDKFSLHNFEYAENLSNLRWTVDYVEDLEFARIVYKLLRHKDGVFLMEDVLELLKQYPELKCIQKDVVRNEGYLKSVEGD